MPYLKHEDLPDSVRDHLPPHARVIYQAAYNGTWDEYHHEESAAGRVASMAVEHQYRKDESSGRWVKDATEDRD